MWGRLRGEEAWQPTDFLSGARHSHSATLLQNGKVLVAGGWSTGSLATCELYDPATGLWERTGDLATPRFAHTATPLAIGQSDGDRRPLLSQYPARQRRAFRPGDRRLEREKSLPSVRERHTATLLHSGKVLVVGGRRSDSGSNQFTSTALIYDPVADSWTSAGSLSTPRQKHTATLLPSGKVLVAGGESGAGILASAEIYDPATGTWTPLER